MNVSEQIRAWLAKRAKHVEQMQAMVTLAAGSGDVDQDDALAPVLAAIEAQVAHPPLIEDLAQQAHFSTRHFSRRFKESFGCTVHHYIAERRLARACELLLQDRMSVTEVAEAVGFASIHTFSRWFRQQTGMTPSQFKKSGHQPAAL